MSKCIPCECKLSHACYNSYTLGCCQNKFVRFAGDIGVKYPSATKTQNMGLFDVEAGVSNIGHACLLIGACLVDIIIAFKYRCQLLRFE